MARFLRTIASLSEGDTRQTERRLQIMMETSRSQGTSMTPLGGACIGEGNSAPPDDSTAGEGAEEGEREADEPPAKRGKT